MQLTGKEIKEQIYGAGGLYNRVCLKIDIETARKTSEITGKTIQNINIFRKRYNKSKAKLDTIIFFAEKLGVD